MNLPKRVEITEVCPRDGFQNIKEWIPTEVKIQICEQLIACGFKKIEATSFVHPKFVPQMSDAKEVLIALKGKYADISFVALTPNIKGVTNALKAGADEITYVISASERHNYENTKQSIEQSLDGMREVFKLKSGTKLRLAIATAFNCPWLGRVPAESVIRIINYGLELGVDEVGIADTIGSANPLQVKELLDVLRVHFPDLDPVLHLHDTRGMGLANVLAALHAGTTKFETAAGGLGGCPFAPGATGNLGTEDLVNMLDGLGIKTGIDFDKLMKAVFRMQKVLPVPINSHMASAISCQLQV